MTEETTNLSEKLDQLNRQTTKLSKEITDLQDKNDEVGTNTVGDLFRGRTLISQFTAILC